jgi:hypothetical protein
MAKIIKRNSEYYVQFYGNGLLFEKYAGNDRDAAEKILNEIETSLPAGAMSNFVPDQDIAAFGAQFQKAFHKNFNETTATEFRNAYGAFTAYLKAHQPQVVKLSGVTPKLLQDYQAHLAGQSANDEVDYQIFLLRRMFEFAITKAYLNDNPAIHVKLKGHRPTGKPSESLIAKKLEGANSSEELIAKFLLGDTSVSERLKLVKWKMVRDKDLRDALVAKLLNAQVPLMKVFEIFDVQDIRALKPYCGWVKTQA